MNTVALDDGRIIIKGGGGGGTAINNQEKSVDITENGTTEVVADAGFTGLSKVVVNTNVASSGGGETNIDYITFFALEDGLEASLSNADCEYRIDGGEWQALLRGEKTQSINAGHSISFRGQGLSYDTNASSTFSVSKRFSASGNPLSLIYGDAFDEDSDVPAYGFCQLFYQCNTLIDATDMDMRFGGAGYWAFYAMFAACQNLLYAPKVFFIKRFIEQGNGCCLCMFHNCNNLLRAPELLPTIYMGGSSDRYSGVFYGCAKLSYIKILSDGWDSSSFSGVASNGVIVHKRNININVPSGWTNLPIDIL